MHPDLGYEALRYLIDEFVFIHDDERRIVFVSPSVEHVLGYRVEEFSRLRTLDLIHPGDLEDAARTAIELRQKDGASYRSVLRLRKGDGSYVWCEVVGRNLLHTDVAGVVSTVRDVSERRALEERLFAQAFVDDLTGLANRRAFTTRLEEAIKESDGAGIGLLLLDLDGFKAINDRFGHEAGDERLRLCADVLTETREEGDLPARLGGDEFAVLCLRVRGERDVIQRAERLRAATEAGRASHGCTMSIGAAVGRRGDDPTTLLRAADRALYAAKRRGRNRVEGGGEHD